ncbi:MAG: NADH-quinone oxidoreductase subunit N [bacterium]
MATIITLSVLGILVLFLGILKQKSLLLPLILVGLLVALVLTFLEWNTFRHYYNEMLIADNYSVAFNTVMILSTFMIFSFAGHYYKGVERPLDDIYAIMIFALTGSVMMTSFGNLIMLFLGIETLSIALYVLAGSHKEAITSNEATLKYFLIGSFISGFLLFGIALIYGSAHSFNLEEIARFIAPRAGNLPPMFLAGLFLFIAGMAFKIAIVPFHFWAPDVYEGTPTLLTAFMASVVKTASIAALYRFFSVTFAGIHDAVWEPTLIILAVLTILVGNLTGLYQPSLKRMLAYSSISHSGYMMLAIIAFCDKTANALLFYTLSYSLATILAFSILMLVRESRGNDLFSSMNGMAKKNPLEAFCLTVAMLSLTGIPPLAGFMAKFFLFSAAIEHGYAWLVIIAILGSAVSAVYYFKPVIAIYFRENEGIELQAGRAFKIHMVVLTLLVIILGLFPMFFTGLI